MDNMKLCANCADMATHYHDGEWLCEPCYDEALEIEEEMDNYIAENGFDWKKIFDL